MFETTIKLVNTALNDKVGEIFCLEALFKLSEDNQLLDPVFSLKAIRFRYYVLSLSYKGT